jgi:hypothetical protein
MLSYFNVLQNCVAEWVIKILLSVVQFPVWQAANRIYITLSDQK